MMAQYNHVDPTFANRILSMAESERVHIRKVEMTKLWAGVAMTVWGMLCGMAALCTLCYLLYYSIEKENTKVAIAIVAILSGIVAVFVLRKPTKVVDIGSQAQEKQGNG